MFQFSRKYMRTPVKNPDDKLLSNFFNKVTRNNFTFGSIFVDDPSVRAIVGLNTADSHSNHSWFRESLPGNRYCAAAFDKNNCLPESSCNTGRCCGAFTAESSAEKENKHILYCATRCSL